MGSEQQFCLRWNNHQSTLISVFDTLLESETLVDVTLAAEGQYLKAHKVVLSACSQYFQELLCHHIEKHPIIILKDVTFQELKALIDYMYRGEVNVSQEQLSALIKTAESLKIKGLADGGDRRPDRKSVPQLSPPLPPVLAPALSGNLSLDSRSMGAGEYATNSPLQHAPREGSISPVSRKRKRIRRRSGDGVGGGGTHEGEVGGGSEQASSSASTISVPNIPATITPVNSGSRTTPGDGDGVDDDGVSGSKAEGGPEDGAQGPASSKQTKSEPGTSLQSHSQTPLLEPKSEYREEDDDDGEADEDSMDNVVALDEDVMDMEGSRDDGLDQKPGPSHGAEVSGQGSGFAPWHMMPDRSGDDIFIPSQEAAAQRESQGRAHSGLSRSGCRGVRCGESVQYEGSLGGVGDWLASGGGSDGGWYAADGLGTEGGHTQRVKGRYVCDGCGKAYAWVSNLTRHVRLECGKEPQFQCPQCHKRTKHLSNLRVHMRTRHPDVDPFVALANMQVGNTMNQPLWEPPQSSSPMCLKIASVQSGNLSDWLGVMEPEEASSSSSFSQDRGINESEARHTRYSLPVNSASLRGVRMGRRSFFTRKSIANSVGYINSPLSRGVSLLRGRPSIRRNMGEPRKLQIRDLSPIASPPLPPGTVRSYPLCLQPGVPVAGKRPRGRPPKSGRCPGFVSVGGVPVNLEFKRPRGRPRGSGRGRVITQSQGIPAKLDVKSSSAPLNVSLPGLTNQGDLVVRRPRGRPRGSGHSRSLSMIDCISIVNIKPSAEVGTGLNDLCTTRPQRRRYPPKHACHAKCFELEKTI